jgi:hypothetical protein
MLGLRTQESSTFEAFFSIVQAEASKQKSIFYCESEDGHDSYFDGMEISDLQGWLIPQNLSKDFESIWLSDEVGDEWDEYFSFVEWEIDYENKLKISFNSY